MLEETLGLEPRLWQIGKGKAGPNCLLGLLCSLRAPFLLALTGAKHLFYPALERPALRHLPGQGEGCSLHLTLPSEWVCVSVVFCFKTVL